MPLGIPIGQDEYRRMRVARRKELGMDGVVFRPGRRDRTRESKNVVIIETIIGSWRGAVPLRAVFEHFARVSADELSRIGVLGRAANVFEAPGKRAHEAIVVRFPASLLIAKNALCKPAG